MRNAIASLMEDARKKSVTLAAALPVTSVEKRANYGRISEVCARMVGASPAREPTSISVAEQGRALFNPFPRPQTLLNHYGDMMRLWREVFRSVITAQAPRILASRTGVEGAEYLDAGTMARLDLAEAAYRELKLENDRLKQLIRETVPAPSPTFAPNELSSGKVDLRSLAEWLEALRTGANGLESTEQGVLISRRGRPGFQAMSAEALDAIRVIVASFSKTSGPS